MMIEPGAAEDAKPDPLRADWSWLSRRRALALVGVGVVGAGFVFNWEWLTSVGAASALLTLAPCLAMCALGLCMRGDAASACRSRRPYGDRRADRR